MQSDKLMSDKPITVLALAIYSRHTGVSVRSYLLLYYLAFSITLYTYMAVSSYVHM